jgi:ABC-type Fe3+-hydroxamate transport system substrate-binding protein
VGVPFTADLEKVADLHPDLIVGYGGAGTSELKQLEAIAPVVSVPLDDDPAPSVQGIKRLSWYPAVSTLATVLNRQAQFNAFIGRYQAAANAARPALAGKSVSMVVVLNNLSAMQVYGPGYYDGVTLSYLGLNVAKVPAGGAIQPNSNNDGTDLSLERVSELTGDYLMFATFAPGVSAKFLGNPLVKRLASVQAGRVIDASTDTPLYGFPSVGCIEQLNLIPKLAQAFAKAGKSALRGRAVALPRFPDRLLGLGHHIDLGRDLLQGPAGGLGQHEGEQRADDRDSGGEEQGAA